MARCNTMFRRPWLALGALCCLVRAAAGEGDGASTKPTKPMLGPAGGYHIPFLYDCEFTLHQPSGGKLPNWGSYERTEACRPNVGFFLLALAIPTYSFFGVSEAVNFVWLRRQPRLRARASGAGAPACP